MATYELINSNGTILVDTASIAADVEAEYRTIYGIGVDDPIDPSTIIGREIDAEITSRTSAARALAYSQNQINPDLADGVHFDALYMLTSGQRDAKEQSTCDCLLSGVSGTIIAAGSFAQDINNELWYLVAETTIPASGSITASFRSENYGAIGAEIGEINIIVSGVLGWETITNAVAATEGKTQQSLVSAKQQRKIELGKNSRGVAGATIAAVSALDGVASLQFRENRQGTPQIIDGLTMPKNSTWICVDGGAGSEIADKYVINTWGTAFYGVHNTITESYADEISEQVQAVYIDRPDDVPLKINVSAKLSGGATGTDSIKEAVIAYANGEIDGANGFTVGNDISPFEISWAVNKYLSAANVYVTLVQVTTVAADSPSSNTLDLQLWQKGSITETNISVTLV